MSITSREAAVLAVDLRAEPGGAPPRSLCSRCGASMRDIFVTSDVTFKECQNGHSLRIGAAPPSVPDRPSVATAPHESLPTGPTNRKRPANSGRPLVVLPERACKRPACPRTFTPSSRHQGQAYCSTPCRLAALDERRAVGAVRHEAAARTAEAR